MRSAAAERADDLRRGMHFREDRPWELEFFDHIVSPDTLPDIEDACGCCIACIGAEFAGQPETNVIFRHQESCRAIDHVGFVFLKPEQRGDQEARCRRGPAGSGQQIRPDPFVDL